MIQYLPDILRKALVRKLNQKIIFKFKRIKKTIFLKKFNLFLKKNFFYLIYPTMYYHIKKNKKNKKFFLIK